MLDLGAVAISCEADEADRAAFRELARRHKTTVAKLVRSAIDAKHGDELAELKPFFVASTGRTIDRPAKRVK
jgi:hypothetical protein